MGNEVLILILEAMTLYLIVLGAHFLRGRFGLAFFYALIGALTAIMSWVTDAGVTVAVGGITFVVGSTVFYTSLLLSVFVVYVFDGPQKTRIAISTVIFISILVPVVAAILHIQTEYIGAAEIVQVPTPDFRINTASVFATLIDLIFLAIAWEFLGKPELRLKLWLRSYATLLGVMWLDVVLFATGAYAGTPNYLGILQGTLISRFIISLMSFPFLYFYLYWQNRKNGVEIENRPVLAILKRAVEAESELFDIKKEMERRRQAEALLRKSESILEATGKMAKVGGWELDAETREVFWTKETYRIHEVPSCEKLTLEKALAFFPSGDKEKLARAIESALENGEPYDLKLRFTTAKGRPLWIRTICRPKLSGGKTIKLKGTFQDITDRKEMEKALEEYRDHLETLVDERTLQLGEAKKQWESTFDAISDWVFIIDKDHRIVRSNKTSETLFGLPPKRVVGKHCYEIVHKTSRPFPGCPVLNAMKGGLPEPMEFQTDDGRWLQVYVDPIEKNSEKDLFVHIVRDITDLKNKEKEIVAARKAEAFSILSGGIAHDYNNLLSVIWGNISLLREDISDAKTRNLFEEAEKACSQAKSLTHQFITLSLGGGLKKSLRQVGDILDAVVAKTRDVGNLEISTVIPDDLPAIEVDPDLFGVALVNIVDNAAEAMSDGGKLEIRAEREIILQKDSDLTERLHLIFEDCGRGIPEADISKVFDPYFTTKEMGSRKGMGLGLAVSKSIVLNHGGDIRIESSPKKGTAVTVTLPHGNMAENVAPLAAAVSPEAIATVLLLEDNPALNKLCERMLKRLNLNVISAENGREAIEKYRSAEENGATIDLLLLDQNIKGSIGGTETLKRLKQLGYDNRAIVVTGSPNSPAILDHAMFGFDGSLLKPYTKNDLKQAVGRFISSVNN